MQKTVLIWHKKRTQNEPISNVNLKDFIPLSAPFDEATTRWLAILQPREAFGVRAARRRFSAWQSLSPTEIKGIKPKSNRYRPKNFITSGGAGWPAGATRQNHKSLFIVIFRFKAFQSISKRFKAIQRCFASSFFYLYAPP